MCSTADAWGPRRNAVCLCAAVHGGLCIMTGTPRCHKCARRGAAGWGSWPTSAERSLAARVSRMNASQLAAALNRAVAVSINVPNSSCRGWSDGGTEQGADTRGGGRTMGGCGGEAGQNLGRAALTVDLLRLSPARRVGGGSTDESPTGRVRLPDCQARPTVNHGTSGAFSTSVCGAWSYARAQVLKQRPRRWKVTHMGAVTPPRVMLGGGPAKAIMSATLRSGLIVWNLAKTDERLVLETCVPRALAAGAVVPAGTTSGPLGLAGAIGRAFAGARLGGGTVAGAAR